MIFFLLQSKEKLFFTAETLVKPSSLMFWHLSSSQIILSPGLGLIFLWETGPSSGHEIITCRYQRWVSETCSRAQWVKPPKRGRNSAKLPQFLSFTYSVYMTVKLIYFLLFGDKNLFKHYQQCQLKPLSESSVCVCRAAMLQGQKCQQRR